MGGLDRLVVSTVATRLQSIARSLLLFSQMRFRWSKDATSSRLARMDCRLTCSSSSQTRARQRSAQRDEWVGDARTRLGDGCSAKTSFLSLLYFFSPLVLCESCLIGLCDRNGCEARSRAGEWRGIRHPHIKRFARVHQIYYLDAPLKVDVSHVPPVACHGPLRLLPFLVLLPLPRLPSSRQPRRLSVIGKTSHPI